MARTDLVPVRAYLVGLKEPFENERFELREEQFIGLAHCSDSEIAVPSTRYMVSRRHARIVFVDGSFWLEDCRSQNGTFCNDLRIDRQRLSHGDVVRTGLVDFRFEQK